MKQHRAGQSNYPEKNEAVADVVRPPGKSGNEISAIFIAALEVDCINRLYKCSENEGPT